MGQVYISGTFTDWKTIPMVKSHGDFVTIIDLPEGEHQFKYFVDGEWRHDPAMVSIAVIPLIVSLFILIKPKTSHLLLNIDTIICPAYPELDSLNDFLRSPFHQVFGPVLLSY